MSSSNVYMYLVQMFVIICIAFAWCHLNTFIHIFNNVLEPLYLISYKWMRYETCERWSFDNVINQGVNYVATINDQKYNAIVCRILTTNIKLSMNG